MRMLTLFAARFILTVAIDSTEKRKESVAQRVSRRQQ